MLLNIEQTLQDYLNEYGFLFENDSVILSEDLKKEKEINDYYEKKKKDLDKQKEKLFKHIEANKDSYIDSLKDFGENLRDNVIADLDQRAEEKKIKVQEFIAARKAMLTQRQQLALKSVKKGGKLVAGITLASALIYTSVKLYQRENEIFKDKCTGLRGHAKNRCLIQARVVSLKKKSQFLKTALTKCKESKDPVTCRNKLDQEILRIEGKIKDLLAEIGGKII